MSRETRLSASMSLTQFRNGYWYATELKRFAQRLGIPFAIRLRKDELERAIEGFLRNGTISRPPNRQLSEPRGRDVDRGLRLDRRIVGYTNNAETKAFLEREARKIRPEFKRRSGARYRLNRWREEQLSRGVPLTYRDLVKEYVRLCQFVDPFARVPHGRYINFVSDFLTNQRAATRADAVNAWYVLKTLNIPKTYSAWTKHQSKGPTRLPADGQSRKPRPSTAFTPPRANWR